VDHAELLSRLNALRDRVANACSRSNRDPSGVRVVVVTKTHPVETLQAVVNCGIRDIGENRVQEIEQKVPHLRGTFDMHMIGHLQSNKVNKVVPFVTWIQSVDSGRIAQKIGSAASATGKAIETMVEVKTAPEETKSGCSPEKCLELAQIIAKTPGLRFRGLMTVGPLGAGEAETRKAFAALRRLSEQCRHLAPHIELSMGMSSDFEWAIEEGSTMIRVGTLLLGNR
jgi:PLP dependent protein